MSSNPTLLPPSFLKKLERLSPAAKRAFAGQMKGEKRSTRRGSSIEFADYREYTPGDDLRYVDWNSAARLDRMYLKLFVEEEDLYLALLVDTSRSMGFGAPDKLQYAVQAAAALGYIGLTNYDRVSVQPFSDSSERPLAMQRGRVGVMPLFSYLSQMKAAGRGEFGAALRRFAAASRNRGLAVVISDFMEAGWEEGVKALLAAGFQVALLHVLSDEEIQPTLAGDLRIIDSETGETREMSVNPHLLTRYRQAFDLFCHGMESFSHRYGVDYLRISTSLPVEELVLKHLRRSGLLQ